MENTTVETVETVEEIVFTSELTEMIDAAISDLLDAKAAAVKLGAKAVSSAVEATKLATAGRASVQKVVVACKPMRNGLLEAKVDIVSDMGEINANKKREKLLAKQAEIAAELAAL